MRRLLTAAVVLVLIALGYFSGYLVGYYEGVGNMHVERDKIDQKAGRVWVLIPNGPQPEGGDYEE